MKWSAGFLEEMRKGIEAMRMSKLQFAWVSSAILAMFLVPYLGSTDNESISASANFSFNNRIALVSLLVSLAVLTLTWRFCQIDPTPVEVFQPENQEIRLRPEGVWLRAFAFLLLLHIFVIAIFLSITVSDPSYGESTYFLLKTKRIMNGEVPFLDQEYVYGPVFAHLPVVFSRLTEGDVRFGYYASLTATSVLSIWCLYFVCVNLRLPFKFQRILFLFIGIAALPLPMGLNGQLVRFLHPIIFLFIVDRFRIRFQTSTINKRDVYSHVTTTAFLASIAVVISLNLSPEIGLALGTAYIVYFLTLTLQKNTFWKWSIFTFFVFSILNLYITGFNFLVVVFTRFSGGLQLPLLPSPYTLAYLAAIFIVVPLITAGHLMRRAGNPVTLGMAALTVGLAPGAIYRPDAPHLFYYGLALSFLTVTAAHEFSPKLTKWILMVMFLLFTVSLNLQNLYWYHLGIGKLGVGFLAHYLGDKRVFELATDCGVSDPILDLIRAHLENEFDPENIDHLSQIAIPFRAEYRATAYVMDRKLYAGHYHDGLYGLWNRTAVEQVISDLQKESSDNILMLREDFPLRGSRVFAADHDTSRLKIFLLTPFLPPFVKDSRRHLEAIDVYLESNFEIVWCDDIHLLLRRRGDVPGVSDGKIEIGHN